MSSLVITADTLVLPDRVITGGSVVVVDGLITEISETGSATGDTIARRIDADGLILSAGLLDIQINGGFGHDFTEEPETIWEVGTRLPAFGVTGFLPTVVTSDSAAREAMREAMRAALAAGSPRGYRGATPLGAHFEGPFLTPQASGAHDPAYLRVPSHADPDVARWSPERGSGWSRWRPNWTARSS